MMQPDLFTMLSDRVLEAATMIPPSASCNNATMRMARWTDPSDLAMVRDWFYPHKVKSRPSRAAFDPYAPSIDSGNDRYSHESESLSGNHTLLQNINKRRAIERVETYAWHDHHLPHALLTTAALIDAQLHYDEGFNVQPRMDANEHAQQHENEFKISPGAMKSILAMAFCRFVNGFVDRDIARSSKALRNTGLSSVGTTLSSTVAASSSSSLSSSSIMIDQQGSSDESSDEEGDGGDRIIARVKAVAKGTGESSMYKYAATIGMPSSFVDVRHKATHGKDLPSLNELLRMTNEALEWLWERWWRSNARGDPTVRLWEVEQWEKAVKLHRERMPHVDGSENQQEQSLKAEVETESNVNQWKSVTQDGITRFVLMGVQDRKVD